MYGGAWQWNEAAAVRLRGSRQSRNCTKGLCTAAAGTGMKLQRRFGAVAEDLSGMKMQRRFGGWDWCDWCVWCCKKVKRIHG